MKNCSALSNVEHEHPKQIPVNLLTLVVCLLLQIKTVENIMARAKAVPVQIRHTLLDAEGLSARVNTESIQYEFMTQIISSLRKLARTK